MKKTALACCLLLSGLIPLHLLAIDINDTRMLAQPAVSQDHLAFIYAEDLWVSNLDGSQPRRLTVDRGVESNPVFSPDGRTIAFSAQYDGNTDVYIIPVEGGIPKRLTWHPSTDIVRGFTPDGSAVLFISQREASNSRYFQLFTVPLKGGPAKRVEIPNAFWAAYSPQGGQLAYTPLYDAFNQWKHYRGGTISTIWIYSFSDKSVVKIPQPEGGCNDVNPMWAGKLIYFRSDRNGEFDLYSYNTADKQVSQLTSSPHFPVLNAALWGGTIVYEQAGYLYKYSLASSSSVKLTIGIGADLLELRPRYARGAEYVRSADISPSGARAVFDVRGDIITVPAEKGDYRNITQTTGVHEKYPAWSPDGKTIAYFSDASGEYRLYLKSQDGSGEPRIIALGGTGFYANLFWSPDSKKISFSDNGRNLYVLDTESGETTKIDADELYVPGAFRNLFGDWSFDSKWIVYNKVTESQFKQIYLYSLTEKKSYPLSDGLSDAAEPKFDKSGKYLYFLASTDAGPVINWFDQSNADMRSSYSIYLVTLQNHTISPLAKESDEEVIPADTTAPGQAGPSPKNKAASRPVAVRESTLLQIDWENIQSRIVDLPVAAGNYSQLGTGREGEIFYVSSPYDGHEGATLRKYDLKARKDSEVGEVDGYVISSDRKKMLYSKSGAWFITDIGTKAAPGKGPLAAADIEVKCDPSQEWKNIFEEAWRVNRDYFYDPGMHGLNWIAIRDKYAVFVPHLSCRSDLNRVLQWMFSELSVGHHFITNPGDRLYKPKKVNGGLLGADYTITSNRYRISKIYGGLNWNPSLKSPLTEPGVNVHTGDFILAVNGQNLDGSEDISRLFENTAGTIVELSIGTSADDAHPRKVRVVPVENESALRNRDWVESNLRKVSEATHGQVAYVYVPNTAELGHDYFKRYFYPQAKKSAIIVDERFNGGGSLADYYIRLLTNPLQAYWNMRYGRDLKTPSASIQGPKVMLIDEMAGSGGDFLPWMFRQFKVGTLVGKRTWGGLVGILGYPELMDGGEVTAPNVGIWTKDGFIVENTGVSPDIEVEQSPRAVMEGHDPQLEKAIEVAMKELEKNPPSPPVRPPYPVKVQNR